MEDEDDEQQRIRRSNRRTIIALGAVVVALVTPSLYRMGKYLIDLL